jgi:hypothetical protein
MPVEGHRNTNALEGLRFAMLASLKAPSLAEGWVSLVAAVEELQGPKAGLEVVDRALAKLPDMTPLWGIKSVMLARLGRWKDSLDASEQTPLGAAMGKHDLNRARLFHFARVDALRRLGRWTEAESYNLVSLGIPFKPNVTRAKQIDLSAFYNAAFTNDWHDPTEKGNNLSNLAAGSQTWRDVVFDARGIVQLAGSEIDKTTPGYPLRLEGIPVELHASRMHFLQGTGWAEPEGTVIAKYVVHYADPGIKEEIPVKYGVSVRDMWFTPETRSYEPAVPEPVWRGPLPRWSEDWPDAGARLYMLSWDNPHPEVKITSLELVSLRTQCAPFIIAVSLE